MLVSVLWAGKDPEVLWQGGWQISCNISMPLTPVPVSGSGLARLPRRGFWSFLPYSWSQLECGAQSLQGHEIQAGQPKSVSRWLGTTKGPEWASWRGKEESGMDRRSRK